MGVAGVALVADAAEKLGLAGVLGEGIAQRLTVDRQALVDVQALQGLLQLPRVDAPEHLALDGATGDPVAAMTRAATETRPRLLARSSVHGLIAVSLRVPPSTAAAVLTDTAGKG